eukprot:tig00021045_g17662.t1
MEAEPTSLAAAAPGSAHAVGGGEGRQERRDGGGETNEDSNSDADKGSADGERGDGGVGVGAKAAAGGGGGGGGGGKARPFHHQFEKQHVVYLLHNGRMFYCGETASLARRFKEHSRGTIRGSFTKSRGPWRLLAVAAPFPNRSLAQGYEQAVKGRTGSSAKRIEAMKKLAVEWSAGGGTQIAVHVNPDGGDAGGESPSSDAA